MYFRQASINDVRELDLRMLAAYWGIGGTIKTSTTDRKQTSNQAVSSNNNGRPMKVTPQIMPMKSDQLLLLLATKAQTIGHKGESLTQKLIHTTPANQDFWTSQYNSKAVPMASNEIVSGLSSVSNHKRATNLSRNYYGLPPMANPVTSDNLLVNCRKPRLSSFLESKESWASSSSQELKTGTDSVSNKSLSSNNDNVDAQRKVALSLLTMSKNEVGTDRCTY
jgi:hypothetical protein